MSSSTAPVKFLYSAFFLSYLLQLTKVSATPVVGFTASSSNETETSGLISIALQRTSQTNISTTVNVTLNGTAIRSTDYIVSGSLLVTFPADDSSDKTIQIFIVNDREVESDPRETIVLTIQPDSAFNISTTWPSHTVSISDDDVNVTCQNADVKESDGTANVTISRSGSTQALNNDHSIGCFTKDDSAVTPSDYTTENSLISFTTSSREKVMSISIADDKISEANETFNVSCYSSDVRVNVQSSCKDATVTIIQDDDMPGTPVVGFTTPSSNKTETSGWFGIQLQRTNKTDIATTVNVTLSGTANRSTDYIVSGSLLVTFPADDLSVKTIQLFIVNDREVESDPRETIVLTIQPDSAFNISTTWPSHTVSISDDDVNVTCQNANVKESDGTANVTISRSGSTQALNNDHSIGCFTKDDSAVASSDYTTENSLISFTTSSREKVMSISIADDKISEANETFNVSCYSSDVRVNVQSSCKDATVTIQDDDIPATPVVGFTTPSSNKTETSGWFTIQLQRTNKTDIATTVNVTLSGSATRGTDYIVSGSLLVTFPADDLSVKTIQFFIVNDREVESDPRETIVLTIQPDSAFNISTTWPSHTVSISDDDVNVTCQNANVKESDGTANVTISRSGSTQALNNDHSIGCFTKDDSAVTPSDYTTENSLISFTTSSREKVMSISIADDKISEANETFNVSCYSSDVRVNVQSSCKDATVTIQDDDIPATPVVGFTTPSSNKTETSGWFTIQLQRTNKTDIATTVNVTLSGSATRGMDYIVSGSLLVTFPADDLSVKTIQFFIVNDREVESDPRETIVLTIQPDSAFNISTTWPSHTVSISDDDVNVNCQNANVKESDGTANVTISRSGSTQALNNDHSIGCFTKDNSAVAPSDYTTENSVISFTNSSQAGVMRISIADDKIPEANETFKVRCDSSDVRVNIQSSCTDATVTIQNDDTYVFFCPGYQTRIRENAGPYIVRLCRVGVLEDTHTVQLCRTSDGGNFPSVTAGCDNVTFGAAVDTQTANIAINNDTRGEQELKTFQIYLQSNDSNVTINDTDRYDVTIRDDDNTFYLTDVSELRLIERTPEIKVNVTINRVGKTSVSSKVSLELNFTQSTAESLDCNGSSPREIDFSANETSKTVTVCTVVDDRLIEDDETFVVQISGVAPSNVNTSASQRTIKLISNDVNVTCRGVSLKEADGPAVVRLDRTGATAITANDVMCFTADGNALSSNDYQARTSATVSFALNVLQKDLNVNLTNDRIVETNESFTVTCNSSDPRVVVDSSCSDIQINIINDDTYVFFCPGYQTRIRENAGPYTVRLCRVGVLEDTHTVQLCRTSDSVSLPHDYPSVEERCDNITFAAYDEIKEHNITVSDDTWGEQEFKIFTISINTTDPGVEFNDTTSYNVTVHDNDNTFYLTDVSELRSNESTPVVNVTVTINRVGETSAPSKVSLELNFTQSTAESPDCSGSSSREIDFSANETSKTVTVCTVVDDRLIEDDETFVVQISGIVPSNVNTSASQRIIKLISNDVNVTCRGVSLKEADGPAVVRLDRTGATAITANDVMCFTADGNALSSNDYQARTSATVSFALNVLQKDLNVNLTNDRIVETNESFTVTCNSSDPRVVVDSSCSDIQINIINDDTYVFFCPGYQTRIRENAGPYTVRLCRVGVLEDTHTVQLCRTSDSVSLPHDYPSVEERCDNITFAAYDEIKEHNITVSDDTWGEQEFKIFTISINTTDPGVEFNDTTSYNVTVHDNDNSFCFTNTSLKVYEEYDEYAILTIRRTGAISVANATVTINTSPRTATTPEDYTDPIINQLTFLVGEIEKNVSIKIVNDKLVEDDQIFQLSLSGANGSTVFPDCMRSTVTIVSNDVNIFCEDRRGFQSVYENKSPVLMVFKREGSLQYNHTIRIRTIPGTAQPGKDYIAIDKTLTFAPHQTNMEENVTFINDNDVEPDETFRLSVTSTDNRVHMICPGTRFTILNDDTFIRCANRSIDVSEGNKTVYFTLKREGVLDKPSRIWFTTKDGTAFAKADYKPRNQVNKTFLSGQVYMTLSVDIVDDEYKEDDEAFSVIIGSYVQTTLTSGDKCTNITIKDDDPNRMTEQQAQELLARRRNFLIIIGVAVAFMALVVMLFIGCVCHILHRFK